MNNSMNEKEIHKEMIRLQNLQRIESFEGEKRRAQSFSIGNAGGGVTEISMRSSNGNFLWATYQPVEIMEFIHQMAANIGCHIHVVPRKDFSSWRNWEISEEEMLANNSGWAPHPQIDREKKQQVGTRKIDFHQELQEESNDESNKVAAKKAVNKRATKQARSSTK